MTLFGKYATFSPAHLKYELRNLQSNYSKLCFFISDVSDKPQLNDLALFQKTGDRGSLSQRFLKATDIPQAYTPNTNEKFILEILDQMINNERYSEFPNHQKVSSRSCTRF